MNKSELINKSKEVFINTYSQLPIIIESGEGVYVKDTDGNKYLDFVAGIAVNCLGYKNKNLINQITKQLNKFTHCSNLYYNEPSILAAELLVNVSGLDKVFFCNSGAEAMESALKLSRKYGYKYKNGSYEIITMKNSFHGRTFGAITATGQEKYQKGLKPLLPGIKYASYNNIESIENLICDKTCAIVVEPKQGEGGIKPSNENFLKDLRLVCDKNNIVLIFDEVQCGIGRTGKMFAYQKYGIKPDIVALAKGLGGGFPVGAIIACNKVSNAFEPGDHATTYGGNPLVTTAVNTVLSEIINKDILKNVRKSGAYLKQNLDELKNRYDYITEVRGEGLMLGMELSINVKSIIIDCIKQGLLLINAGLNVIRFVPPLIVNKHEIDEAILKLENVLKEVKG